MEEDKNITLTGYCSYWNNVSKEERRYHDEEWGFPISDDNKHFEYLSLEALQCGLSWSTIFNKRDIFRKVFSNFNYDTVRKFTEKDVERIFNTPGMLKSERKILATISNAECFSKIVLEFGSFSNYLKHVLGNYPVVIKGHSLGNVPSENYMSQTLAKDLKKRGFKFLGTVTTYACLQASGVILDHSKDCPCFKKITEKFKIYTSDGNNSVLFR